MKPRVHEKGLRIVLSEAATQAYGAMVEQIKSETLTVKIQPSQFVSFLVGDFFETYFAKDRAILIAEFFDSDAYFEAERRKAKGSSNYEEIMAAALDEARKVKSKRRIKAARAEKKYKRPEVAIDDAT